MSFTEPSTESTSANGDVVEYNRLWAAEKRLGVDFVDTRLRDARVLHWPPDDFA
jgi:hypothetical protein